MLFLAVYMENTTENCICKIKDKLQSLQWK